MIWTLEKVGYLWFPTPASKSGWKMVEDQDGPFATELRQGYEEWADANAAAQKAQSYCGLQAGG